MDDTELIKLIPFLQQLSGVPDVRDVLSQCVTLNEPIMMDD